MSARISGSTEPSIIEARIAASMSSGADQQRRRRFAAHPLQGGQNLGDHGAPAVERTPDRLLAAGQRIETRLGGGDLLLAIVDGLRKIGQRRLELGPVGADRRRHRPRSWRAAPARPAAYPPCRAVRAGARSACPQPALVGRFAGSGLHDPERDPAQSRRGENKMLTESASASEAARGALMPPFSVGRE